MLLNRHFGDSLLKQQLPGALDRKLSCYAALFSFNSFLSPLRLYRCCVVASGERNIAINMSVAPVLPDEDRRLSKRPDGQNEADWRIAGETCSGCSLFVNSSASEFSSPSCSPQAAPSNSTRRCLLQRSCGRPASRSPACCWRLDRTNISMACSSARQSDSKLTSRQRDGKRKAAHCCCVVPGQPGAFIQPADLTDFLCFH